MFYIIYCFWASYFFACLRGFARSLGTQYFVSLFACAGVARPLVNHIHHLYFHGFSSGFPISSSITNCIIIVIISIFIFEPDWVERKTWIIDISLTRRTTVIRIVRDKIDCIHNLAGEPSHRSLTCCRYATRQSIRCPGSCVPASVVGSYKWYSWICR